MRNQNGFMRELDYVTYLPYVIAGDLERSRKYVGTEDTLMFVYHAADTIEVWKHDNITPGGVLIASTTGAGAGSFFNNNMAVLAGTTLTVTQVNGNAVSVDLASLIPADVKLVGLAVAGDIVTATMSDGATIPLDLSSLTGNSLVNLQMIGSDLIATAKDGTLITIPLGALADGGVTAFALTADTLTLTRMDGTLFNVDLAKYQETLTKMSAYIWTFSNGEGGTTTIDVNLSKLSGDFPAASYLGNRGTLENLLVAIDAELEDHDARLTLLEGKQDVYVTSMSTIQSSTDGSNSVITLNMSNGTTHSITTQDADKDTTLTTGSMVGNTLHLGNGAGTVVTIDLTPVDTENASMNMNGDILQLTDTDGNVVSVDLSQFMDDTDTNVTNATFVLSGNVLTMTESNGNSVSVDLSVLANDTTVTNASMGLNGNVLQLTDTNGQVVAVDLSPVIGPDTNTKIASYVVSGSTLIITDTDGGTFSVPLQPVVASLNSANGVVSHALVGTTLRLTLLDGTIHNVNLASLATVDTNTLNTAFALVGDALRLTDSDGNFVQVDMSGFLDDTDVSAARISYTQASRTLTVGVTEDGVEVTDTQVLPDPVSNDANNGIRVGSDTEAFFHQEYNGGGLQLLSDNLVSADWDGVNLLPFLDTQTMSFHRLGNFVTLSGQMEFNGCAVPVPTDGSLSIVIDLDGLGADTGLYANTLIANSTVGTGSVGGNDTGNGDTPEMPCRTTAGTGGALTLFNPDYPFAYNQAGSPTVLSLVRARFYVTFRVV